MSKPMLLATCRFAPMPDARNIDVPLAAGHYEVLRVTPRSDAADRVAAQPAPRGQCLSCAESQIFAGESEKELPTGDIALVVHGFNCTAYGGIQTAYYIRDSLDAWGVALREPGAETPPRSPAGAVRVMGFTWPCEHTLVPGYMDDKAAVARFAAFSLANLLLDLRRADPQRQIHLVAHSMGCFLTLKALNMLAVLHGSSGELPIVNQVIWLAPDINADALERSTPDREAPNRPGWQPLTSHPRRWRLVENFARFWRQAQPAPVAAPPAAGAAPSPIDHPLDGYGYAALDGLDELRIYSSFDDEALVVSPWANQTTEEHTSASGAIRLGWCGPLHPERILPAKPAAGKRQPRPHRVTLVDCSQVAHEHGDYFFVPAVQRDIASALDEAERAAHPTLEQARVTPPPERQQTRIWRRDGRLPGFLPDASSVVGAVRFFCLRGGDELPPWDLPGTAPREGAPSRGQPTGLSGLGLGLWHSPLGHAYIWLARRYYGV